MDNFTKNILAGIRQWFHKSQDDAQVVLTSHIADTKDRIYAISQEIEKIQSSLSEVNSALKERLKIKILSTAGYEKLFPKYSDTLYLISDAQFVNAYIGETPIYSVQSVDADAFYLKAEGVDSTVSISLAISSTNEFKLEYSFNYFVWFPYTSNSELSLKAGQKLYLRGDNKSLGSQNEHTRFTLTGRIGAYGNIQYLCGKSSTAEAYAYQELFVNCKSLVKAPDLPATTLKGNCYLAMFKGCTSLTEAPILPAAKLISGGSNYFRMFQYCTSLIKAPGIISIAPAYCCEEMFDGCSALTEAPELTAKVLYNSSYRSMFRGCSNLAYIKCLATDLSANASVYGWVEGVAATGTFVKAAGSSWPNGQSGIPAGWTVEEVEPESSNQNAE